MEPPVSRITHSTVMADVKLNIYQPARECLEHVVTQMLLDSVTVTVCL